MKEVHQDTWHSLYKEKWTDLICPDAVAHPAKFSRALIRKIYEHAIEEGWLGEGSTVLDPFGGVALGAFDALYHGMNWIGCELEPRFVELGNKNIEHWLNIAKSLRGIGTAKLLQGDSRKLSAVIELSREGLKSSPPYSVDALGHNGKPTEVDEQKKLHSRSNNKYGETDGQLAQMKEGDYLEAMISSPPFGEALSGGGISARKRGEGTYNLTTKLPGNIYQPAEQGVTEGNLANLKVNEEDFQAVISSPPYAGNEKSDYQLSEDGRTRRRDVGRGFRQGHGCFRGSETYGQSEGQLGTMRDSDFNAVITSPPFVESLASDDPVKRGGLFRDEKRKNDKTLTATYGESAGQVGTMKEGEFDSVISSPPYEGSLDHAPGNKNWKEEALGVQAKYGNRGYSANILNNEGYGTSKGNLGNMTGGRTDFDSVVTSPPFEKGSEGVMRASKFKDPVAFALQQKDKGHGASFEAKFNAMQKDDERAEYGNTAGNIGNEQGETFWSASRLILEECHKVLAPGSHACFVVKNFVRNKQIVPFCEQWAELCEAVGFRLLHIHRAMLVEYHGEQHGLFGETEKIETHRKSFFRRLHEKKFPDLAIDYECVLCFERV